MEKEMEKRANLRFFCVIVVIIVAIVSLNSFLNYVGSRPKMVKDETTIEWLETRDPDSYRDVKEKISLYLEEEYQMEPTKVVFKVSMVDVFSPFTVDIWYKYEDTWYRVTLKEGNVKDSDLCGELNRVAGI